MSEYSYNDFLAACAEGDLKKVDHLLPYVQSEVDYQSLVSAARMGHFNVVKYLRETCGLLECNSTALRLAAKFGREDVTEYLLKYADAQDNHGVSLWGAAQNGHLGVIKLILAASPNAPHSIALDRAASNGHADVVDYLLSHYDCKEYVNAALSKAVSGGHTEVVKCLLPVLGSKVDVTYALQYAAGSGFTDIVKILLPVSNPKANDSEAIAAACFIGHSEIVDLLWSVSDPKIALQKMKEQGRVPEECHLIEERLKIEESQKELTCVLAKTHQEKQRRKAFKM